MSAYGPAIFISRRDGAELTEAERQRVLELAREAAARLRLRDENGEPARPRPHGYEEGTLAVLLHSGYVYSQMPAPIQADQDDVWTAEGDRVTAEIEKAVPGVYAFEAYGVED
ncbi:hypothetical protein ACFY36_41665 [Actinoplanes sp. NPDC000266]